MATVSSEYPNRQEGNPLIGGGSTTGSDNLTLCKYIGSVHSRVCDESGSIFADRMIRSIEQAPVNPHDPTPSSDPSGRKFLSRALSVVLGVAVVVLSGGTVPAALLGLGVALLGSLLMQKVLETTWNVSWYILGMVLQPLADLFNKIST